MELYYKEYGSKFSPTVVFLHGLLSSGDTWYPIVKKLQSTFHCIVPDSRNHGSSFHAEHICYECMVEDLHSLLTDLKLCTVSLVGHSMGGRTAMVFSSMYPEMVEKLVIVDAGIHKFPDDRILNTMRIIHGINLKEFKDRKDIENTLAGIVPSLTLQQVVLKNIRRTPDGSYEWKINLFSLLSHYSLLASELQLNYKYEGPTLILRSNNSEYVTDEDIQNIQQFFPNIHWKIVPNTGHSIHIDAPLEFTSIVREFLL